MRTPPDSTGLERDPYRLIADILDANGVVHEHSPEAESEARQWQAAPGIDDPALSDWRHLPFITIDNHDSFDLDQAIFVSRQVDGYRVCYALADAAWYIRPGSALFADALARGASYYTPAAAVPMLPRRLSEGLISLNPGVERRALVFDIRLDAAGHVNNTRVTRARIKSRAKLSYAGVQALLDTGCHRANTGSESVDYDASLSLLSEVGQLRLDIAREQDVIEFDRSDTEIRIEGNPPEFVLRARKRLMVERYNEQISLLCNREGAALLERLTPHSPALQAVYRVHEAPDKRSQRALRKTLDALVERLSLPDAWRWHNELSLADYVAGLPREGNNRWRALAVERQILMTWRASEFSAEPGRHHALAADSYARFSSPMREIVGTFTHKELLDALHERHATSAADKLLRDAVIRSANSARQTQKALDRSIELAVIDARLREDLHTDPRPRYPATLLGLRDDRLYLGVDGFGLDLKLYKADLEQRHGTPYRFEPSGITAVNGGAPSWSLGDRLQLSVRAFDETRQRFVLDIEPLPE